MTTAPQKHALHWLPNALTTARIFCIPLLIWLILNMSFNAGLCLAAIALFAACMITDFLDGYLARKWTLVSDYGRMLDPIADKLLVAAGLICMVIVSQAPWFIIIPALTIIGRDIFVSGIREHAANANIILSPTKLAKWKTTFEMIAILLYLVSEYIVAAGATAQPGALITDNVISDYMFKAAILTLWLAALLSAYTGFHYFRSAMR